MSELEKLIDAEIDSMPEAWARIVEVSKSFDNLSRVYGLNHYDAREEHDAEFQTLATYILHAVLKHKVAAHNATCEETPQ